MSGRKGKSMGPPANAPGPSRDDGPSTDSADLGQLDSIRAAAMFREAQVRLEGYHTRLRNLRRQIDKETATGERLDAELAELEVEDERETQAMDKAQDDLEEQLSLMQQMTTKIDDVTSRFNKSQYILDQAKRQCNKASDKLSKTLDSRQIASNKMREAIKRAQDLPYIQDAQLREVEEEEERLVEKFAVLKIEVSRKKEELEQKMSAVSGESVSVQDAMEECEQARLHYRQEIEQVKTNTEILESEIAEQEQMNAELDHKISDLLHTMNQITPESELAGELSEWKERGSVALVELNEWSEQADKENDQLTATLNQLLEHKTSLEDSLIHANATIAEKDSATDALRKQATELGSEIDRRQKLREARQAAELKRLREEECKRQAEKKIKKEKEIVEAEERRRQDEKKRRIEEEERKKKGEELRVQEEREAKRREEEAALQAEREEEERKRKEEEHLAEEARREKEQAAALQKKNEDEARLTAELQAKYAAEAKKKEEELAARYKAEQARKEKEFEQKLAEEQRRRKDEAARIEKEAEKKRLQEIREAKKKEHELKAKMAEQEKRRKEEETRAREVTRRKEAEQKKKEKECEEYRLLSEELKRKQTELEARLNARSTTPRSTTSTAGSARSSRVAKELLPDKGASPHGSTGNMSDDIYIDPLTPTYNPHQRLHTHATPPIQESSPPITSPFQEATPQNEARTPGTYERSAFRPFTQKSQKTQETERPGGAAPKTPKAPQKSRSRSGQRGGETGKRAAAQKGRRASAVRDRSPVESVVSSVVASAPKHAPPLSTNAHPCYMRHRPSKEYPVMTSTPAPSPVFMPAAKKATVQQNSRGGTNDDFDPMTQAGPAPTPAPANPTPKKFFLSRVPGYKAEKKQSVGPPPSKKSKYFRGGKKGVYQLDISIQDGDPFDLP